MESSDFSRANTGADESTGSKTSTNGSSMGSSSSTNGMDDAGSTDKASAALSGAKDKLADVGSTVRDRAGSAKDSLADALESGANKLRQRGGDNSLSGATATGGSVAVADDAMSQVTTKVAGGMEATADWLREADLDGMKASVEKQVKEHPGRTLLIAVGVGYLLGKALRK